MNKYLITGLFLLYANSCCAATQAEEEKPDLSQLAAESDLVALAQVVATEYEYLRGFPSSGVATLRILIAYKAARNFDLIQVAEQGLKDIECYFPEVSAWEEGRRFLVFLENVEVDQFKGHPRACALPILVTDKNLYALRMPQDAASLGVTGDALVQDLDYADPAARIDTSELTSTAIDNLIAEFKLRRVDEDLIYTRGILLTDVRQLIGSQALQTD